MAGQLGKTWHGLAARAPWSKPAWPGRPCHTGGLKPGPDTLTGKLMTLCAGGPQDLAQQVIEVSAIVDVVAAREAAKAVCEAAGLDRKAIEEVAIAVSELATNLVKHAKRGRLVFTLAREGKRTGIQIESVDSGPGIPDLQRAMSDGYSTSGSLGYGLGAVNRLMDEFDIAAPLQGGKGTRITCRRWRKEETPAFIPCPLEFGVATRARTGETVNGDAFVSHRWGTTALVGIIDGLGHGPLAFRAAQTARLYVESHAQQPLRAIFSGTNHSCRATNGVVMALARFDWRRETMSFAAVGNIESRVFAGPRKLNFIVRRGVIGLNAPEAVVTEHPWRPQDVMVLHSDGLSSHWSWEDFPRAEDLSADALAYLLLRLARDDDDATVLVVRGAR